MCVLGATALLAACGSARLTASSQVRTALSAFGRAYAAGDGARACQLLGPDQVTELVRRASRNGTKTCRQVVVAASRRLTPSRAQGLRQLTVSGIRVRGETAVAEIHTPGSGSQVRLSAIGGRWLITYGVAANRGSTAGP